MASLNKVLLIGNLTADPEPKFLPSGQCVCNMRLATNRKWKDASGAPKEEVTYSNVEAWGKSGESAAEFLKKGSPVLIEGRLHYKEWTDPEGKKRSALSVVAERVQFLSGKKDNAPAEDDIPFG